jgi:hypothetical protein
MLSSDVLRIMTIKIKFLTILATLILIVDVILKLWKFVEGRGYSLF